MIVNADYIIVKDCGGYSLYRWNLAVGKPIDKRIVDEFCKYGFLEDIYFVHYFRLGEDRKNNIINYIAAKHFRNVYYWYEEKINSFKCIRPNGEIGYGANETLFRLELILYVPFFYKIGTYDKLTDIKIKAIEEK